MVLVYIKIDPVHRCVGGTAMDSSHRTGPFVEHFCLPRRAFERSHDAKAGCFFPFAGQANAEGGPLVPGAFGGQEAHTAPRGGRAYRDGGGRRCQKVKGTR